VTTHSTSDPRSPQHQSRTTNSAGSATAPQYDGVTVPITVWRLDGGNHTDAVEGFATRLARRLVEVYTAPHDTVADFDSDAHLDAATHAAARTYLNLAWPASLQALGEQSGGAALIVCRWPRATDWPTKPTTLLAACHLIRTLDGCVIAAIRRRQTDQLDYADHTRTLQMAAHNSGYTHVLQIVAVGGPDTGDQFVYYATHAEATEAVDDEPGDAQICYIDVLAYTPSRRDSSPEGRRPSPSRETSDRRTDSSHPNDDELGCKRPSLNRRPPDRCQNIATARESSESSPP